MLHFQRRCSDFCQQYYHCQLFTSSQWQCLSKYVLGEQSMKAASLRCKTKDKTIRLMSIYSANNMFFCPLFTQLSCIPFFFVRIVITQIPCSIFHREQFMRANVFFSHPVTVKILFSDVYKASKNLFAMSPIDNQSSQ